MTRYRNLVLILAVTALPYLAALNHAFVYDDHGSIAENTFLESPRNLLRVLSLRTITDPTVPDGLRPVVIASYFADRAVWRLRPAGYHATNLLIHLANVALVYALLRRLRAAAFVSAAAALLFGLHPVLIEAVQAPAFREDLLFSFFSLLYLLAASANNRAVILSVPALALALLSKESAIVSPILLYAIWACFPAARPGRGVRAAILALSAVLSAAFAAAWFRAGPPQAAVQPSTGLSLPFPENLLTGPWLWLTTLRLFAWPWPLVVDRLVDPVASPADPRWIAGILAGGGWLALALFLFRRHPVAALGALWLMISFLPASNVLPLHNPFAERYLYFGAAGFAMIAATAIGGLKPRASPAGVLAVVCAVFAAVSLVRLRDWRNDYALWSATLARQPASARAHTWVGLELKHQGRLADAARHFAAADELNPEDVSALVNYGVLLGQQGLLEESVNALREAVRRRPDKADAHWNLAVALSRLGRTNEAIAEVERTLAIEPRHRAASATGPAPGMPRN